MASDSDSPRSPRATDGATLIQPATLNPAENPSSPFYLHANENPSLVLVSTPLTETNYHSWSRCMRMALFSKNKAPFIDGTIAAPDPSSPLFDVWQRCHNMVISWIIHSVSPAIGESLLYYDNAAVAWRDLKVRFAQGHHFRISDLQGEMHSIRQGNMSVNDYFTKLKIMWDEYRILRPQPLCSFGGGCDCAAVKQFQLSHDTDQILCFLKGLNSVFGQVRSNILMMEPLPTVEKVFALVVQQEKQLLEAMVTQPTEANAFLNQSLDGHTSKTPPGHHPSPNRTTVPQPTLHGPKPPPPGTHAFANQRFGPPWSHPSDSPK